MKRIVALAVAGLALTACSGGGQPAAESSSTTSTTSSSTSTTATETITSEPQPVDTAAVLCWGDAGIDLLALQWEDDVLGTRGTPIHAEAFQDFSDQLDNRATALDGKDCGGEVELAQAKFDVSLLGLPITVQGEGADADYVTAASSLNAWASSYSWYDGEGFVVPGP